MLNNIFLKGIFSCQIEMSEFDKFSWTDRDFQNILVSRNRNVWRMEGKFELNSNFVCLNI